MKVKPTDDQQIQLLLGSDEVYPVTSPRGRVFIIHNDEFDDAANNDQANLDDREGSDFDLKRLAEIFDALDFVVQSHSNLSSKRMLEMIDKETEHSDHEKYGMFILVIMSHGTEGVIYGSDSREVSINDITRRVADKNFPSMAGKPKIAIVQACAGENVDNAVYMVKTDNPRPTVEVDNPTPMRRVKSTVADFVIVQASCPGYKSYRDSRSGSFMIQSLISALKDFSCKEDFKDLVVRVRNRVLQLSEEKNNEENFGAQTVHLSETLRKKLYFFPGMPGQKLQLPIPVECTGPVVKIPLLPESKPRCRKRGILRLLEGVPMPRAWTAMVLVAIVALLVGNFSPPTITYSATTSVPTAKINLEKDQENPPARLDIRDKPCLLKRHKATFHGGSFPDCSPDGYFSPLQCEWDECWCVRKQTGRVIPGTRAKRPQAVPDCNYLEPASYRLHEKTKLTYIDTIITPNNCFSVAFQSHITEAASHSELDNKHAIFHGGVRYNSLTGTHSNVHINCVRSFGMNLLVQMENNMDNDITKVVAYDRATLSVATYVQGHNISVNFNSVYLTHITKIDDFLVQTGANKGKVYFFSYSTGELIYTVVHPDLKHPIGICHDEQTKDIYITDNVGFSIFKLVISGEEVTINKLAGSRVVKATGIAMHDGKLLVISDTPDPKLHILKTTGEVVTVIGLPECKRAKVLDVSVNHPKGRVAIANEKYGVHIYQIA